MVDWYTQLLKYGIEIPNTEQFLINCPLPDHNDRRASCSINTDKGVWICYAGCGQGSLISLISGISQKSITQLKGELDIPVLHSSFFDPVLEEPTPDDWSPVTYNNLDLIPDDHWIYSRGFTKDILNKWRCRQNIDGDLIIPVYSILNELLGHITRRQQAIPKYLFTQGFKKSKVLFGANQLSNTDLLLVVEGVLDTLWLDQHNYSSVAVLGASVSKYQIDLLAQLNPKEIVLCLDNDLAGEQGMMRALKTKGISLDVAFEKRFMVSFIDFPSKYKDFQEVRNSKEIESLIKNRSVFK